jgi:serine/threonine protein kinase
VFGDKYELVAPLGQGGMGSVWKARHVAVGNHVALRVMRADVAGRQSEVQRFCREARISSSLSPFTSRQAACWQGFCDGGQSAAVAQVPGTQRPLTSSHTGPK